MQRKKQSKHELKEVQRINAASIRDVLRKRLKGEEIDKKHYQQQDDKTTSYRSDKADHRTDISGSQRRIYDHKSYSGGQLQVYFTL